MSQIINAIPPQAIATVCAAMVGWVGHMLWMHQERQHVANGMATIRRFMRGNDEFLTAHQERHRGAYAIEADKPVDAEVLHVEHATGELPALPAHANTEESAPDRAGMWRVLLGLANDLVDRAHDWLPNLLQQWRERNDVGTGETAVAVDRFERFRIDDSPRGRSDEQPSEVEERALLDTAWADANPPTNRAPYVGRHWSAGTEHTDLFPVVNPSIPAQRTDGDLR